MEIGRRKIQRILLGILAEKMNGNLEGIRGWMEMGGEVVGWVLGLDW